MTVNTINTSIRTRLKNQIIDDGDGNGPLDVQFPGEEYKPTANTTWIHIQIIPTDTQQIDIGQTTQRERHSGIVQATVMSPANKGVKSAEETVERIAAAFRRQTFMGVTYRTPRPGTPISTGDKWQSPIVIPYYSDFIN